MSTWSIPDRYRLYERRSAIAPAAWFSSVDAAAMAGWSYRQLNYLAIKMHWNPGSGVHRRWSLDQVRRLRIAFVLHEAVPFSRLPDIALAVLDGPEPPEDGWVAYFYGTVCYGASPAVALRDIGAGAVTRVPKLLDPGAET